MPSYDPVNPDWFFTECLVEPETLSKIQKELLFVHSSKYKADQTNKFYIRVAGFFLMMHCPSLIAWLNTADLGSGVSYAVMSADSSTNSNIHVDTAVGALCPLALNIPVRSCENTYTAWFSTSDSELVSASVITGKPYEADTNYALAKRGTTTELARVSSTKVAFVNPSVLHCGITSNPDRVIASIRFRTQPTKEQMIKLGSV